MPKIIPPEMSLSDQIGQLFMVGFQGTSPSAEIIRMIEQHRVGGIILFSRNVREPQQILDLTRSLQECARAAGHSHPLLISTDQENGMVQRIGRDSTIFPGNMALGATRSERLAHDIALAAGRELKALGVNMNLAPVVDVNNNPANPVIGIRSFSEDPRLVARLGLAALRGYELAGVLATLKHFPGHGDTATDSHLALPVIPYDLERLEQIELVPFKECITAGASCIMTSHIYFPALMGDEVLPATISPAIIQQLLRDRLGFRGLVITDCLEMNAVSETVGIARGSVQALQAGADIVLISHRADRQQEGIEAVTAALAAGALSAERLREAVEHVLEAKQRFLSWHDVPELDATVPAWVGGGSDQRLRNAAYNQAITLVRDEAGLLPLRLEDDARLWILAPEVGLGSQAEERRYPRSYLATCLQRYHPRAEMLPAPGIDIDAACRTILETTAEDDLIVAFTANATHDSAQAELLKRLLATRRRVIGVAVSRPYDLLAFPELATYLTTYEYTKPALDALARVLFGEIEARGRLPVSLPGLYTLEV